MAEISTILQTVMLQQEKQLLEKYPSLMDMELLARRRLPFVAWEYLESGTGDEDALDRNRRSFSSITLTPGIMKGALDPDLSVDLLGRRYSLPFGIAPVGLTGLIWPGAEFQLAQTAVKFGIPFCLSTVATQTPEAIGPVVGNMGWFQLYPPRQDDIRRDLLQRARDSGFHTLVVTADVPVPSRRERIKRAGLRMPPKTTPKMIWDALTHPSWTAATIKYGSPRLKTIEKYTRSRSRAAAAAYVNENLGGTLSWDYLRELTHDWDGPVILKGLLDPKDAVKAAEIGAAGIVVSNHGGRQFDAAPAAMDVLPEIAAAVNGRLAVLFDSGIRTGLDIIKAYAGGADFVFLGRAFLYGLAALGNRGAEHVCRILTDELVNNMQQLGCSSLNDLRNLSNRAK
jgi:L-lactate dehydrogenase (cytochrome)